MRVCNSSPVGEVAVRSADGGVSPHRERDTPPPASLVPLPLQGRKGFYFGSLQSGPRVTGLQRSITPPGRVAVKPRFQGRLGAPG